MFCGNNCGNSSCLWIILILILLFCCGGTGSCGSNCGCSSGACC